MRRLRKEKRRLTRKMRAQRGGADIRSIEDWLSAVGKTPIFAKTTDEVKPDMERAEETLRLGEYRMENLADSALKLPPGSDGTVEPNFNINIKDSTAEPKDIRAEGAGLLVSWKDFMFGNPSPTPVDFKEYIQQLMSPETTQERVDPDFIRYTMAHLMRVENKLRGFTDKEPISSLADDAKYPLFVWSLMMNLPDGEPVPELVPSSKESAPASLTEQAS